MPNAIATVFALARLGEAASSSRPDATCTRLWMPLTSKMLSSLPPSMPLPVSKFESTMKPRMPASSSDRPASRQYHCAGVRRRSARSLVVVRPPPAACAPDVAMNPPDKLTLGRTRKAYAALAPGQITVGWARSRPAQGLRLVAHPQDARGDAPRDGVGREVLGDHGARADDRVV